jgi:hypothetical protein
MMSASAFQMTGDSDMTPPHRVGSGEVREIRKTIQPFIEDGNLMGKKCVPMDPHDQIRYYFSKHKLAVIVSFERSGIGFALNIYVQSDD